MGELTIPNSTTDTHLLAIRFGLFLIDRDTELSRVVIQASGSKWTQRFDKYIELNRIHANTSISVSYYSLVLCLNCTTSVVFTTRRIRICHRVSVSKATHQWISYFPLQTDKLPEISFNRLSPMHQTPFVGTTGTFSMCADFKPSYLYSWVRINLQVSDGKLVEAKLMRTSPCLQIVNPVTMDQQFTR